jgi:hypothetical protein
MGRYTVRVGIRTITSRIGVGVVNQATREGGPAWLAFYWRLSRCLSFTLHPEIHYYDLFTLKRLIGILYAKFFSITEYI